MLGGITLILLWMTVFNPMPSKEEIAGWISKTKPVLVQTLEDQDLQNRIVRDSLKISASNVEVLKLESYEKGCEIESGKTKPANTIFRKATASATATDPATAKKAEHFLTGKQIFKKLSWDKSDTFFVLCKLSFTYKQESVLDENSKPVSQKFKGFAWFLINRSVKKAVPVFLVPAPKAEHKPATKSADN